MHKNELHYDLPDAAIAQEPIEPRDAARLLDTRTSTDHRFKELPDLLAPGDLVVVNTTRVRQARLLGAKAASGGEVELLLLDHRGGDRWDALVRPARRVREGLEIEVGDTTVTVISPPDEGKVIVEIPGDAEVLMEAYGEVPLPPYIRSGIESPERYQTVYGQILGSAAAPTAGLHFTQAVLDGLAQRGVEVAHVDLHVGLDTFRPITTDRVEDHDMHSEFYEVPAATVDAVHRTWNGGGRVVAVGTTVVRSLESAAGAGRLAPSSGYTRLFITPGFRFRVVDLLITNFHVPGSSLLAMVSAFMGPEWRDTYAQALRSGYRFLSFGDAMLAARSDRAG
ncbi:MAG: tRNA preQ1(34) S-adenosylmethionine ribosyltransferase-isomerase QueA [Acidimicrobiia bacterium]|nr:tRNA preQ1(34) S-adenosylmethionine ribosyltransferase-isomerase QueA [Acidimicrobiia bacterium]